MDCISERRSEGPVQVSENGFRRDCFRYVELVCCLLDMSLYRRGITVDAGWIELVKFVISI